MTALQVVCHRSSVLSTVPSRPQCSGWYGSRLVAPLHRHTRPHTSCLRCQDHSARFNDGVTSAQAVAALLPIVLTHQSDTDVELAALAKHTLTSLGSWLRIGSAAVMNDVLSTLTVCSMESSWYARAAVLTYVTLFRAYHLFQLGADQDATLLNLVRAVVCACGTLVVFDRASPTACHQVVERLEDKQVDVQELASKTLVGLLMTATEAQQVELTAPFFKMAATKIPKAGASAVAAGDPDADARKKRKKVSRVPWPVVTPGCWRACLPWLVGSLAHCAVPPVFRCPVHQAAPHTPLRCAGLVSAGAVPPVRPA